MTLLPFSEKMLSGLQRLTKENEPHSCGGFTTDDMQWKIGVAFTSKDDLYDALDELEQGGFIRFAGFDDEDAIGTCYELVEKMKLEIGFDSEHLCFYFESRGSKRILTDAEARKLWDSGEHMWTSGAFVEMSRRVLGKEVEK